MTRIDEIREDAETILEYIKMIDDTTEYSIMENIEEIIIRMKDTASKYFGCPNQH